MVDKAPTTSKPAAKPTPPKSEQRQAELDEQELKEVSGGAGNHSDIPFTKTTDQASP
jgi:hypothetical protein